MLLTPTIHPLSKKSTYYNFEDIEKDLFTIYKNNNTLTTLEIIGYSFENRPIYAIKIGKHANAYKPSILILANIHAREDYTSLLAMKQIEYIINNYNNPSPYNLKEILNTINIWFIPLANPDGLNIVHNGIHSSKNYLNIKNMLNVTGNYNWWKANANGVDLNRNFDDGFWHQRHSFKIKSSERYKGDTPNSEPETKSIQSFCIKTSPLMSLSYHSYGDALFWADTHTHHLFNGLDSLVSNKLSKLTGYKLMPISSDIHQYSCGFENWFRTTFQRISICLEISPVPTSFYIRTPYKIFNHLIYEKAKFTCLELANLAIQKHKTRL